MVLYVGQRVVCVNDRRWPRGYTYRVAWPRVGEVYTVRALAERVSHGYDENGLHLVEIVNPVRVHGSPTEPHENEVAFRVSRFRPVRGSNIDVFLAMLEPASCRRRASSTKVLEPA